MEADFWRERWAEQNIAFHEGEANALFVKHFDRLQTKEGARIFVPLCGKTRDIHWLLEQGRAVVGIELSQIAIDDLFAELGVEPVIETVGELKRYSAPNLEVYVGDFFALSHAQLGAVDAIYDRAALVALPEPMRAAYARRLAELTDIAPQLLISLEYDQSLMDGPPFSVVGEMVRELYKEQYELIELEAKPIEGGLRGTPTTEVAYTLARRG